MNFSKSYLDFKYYKFPDAKNFTLSSKTLILIPDKPLSAEETALLDSILKAIKLDATKYTKLIISETSVLPLALCTGFEQVEAVLSFGVSPAQLGLLLEKVRMVQAGDKTFFFAPAPAVLLKNKSEKVLLWNNLKPHFI